MIAFFDPYLAKKYGLHEAIILEYIRNAKDKFQNNKYWANMSRIIWITEFFYLTEYEYYRAIENLEQHLFNVGDYYTIMDI